MGTSASSSGPNNSSPLIPPWAEHSEPLEIIPGNSDGRSLMVINQMIHMK